jgi:hypothetical protein
VNKAGESLALLSLENKQNCQRMMSIKLRDHPNLIASLISVLDDPVQGFHGAGILRNLCAYAEVDYIELKKISATTPQVVSYCVEISRADDQRDKEILEHPHRKKIVEQGTQPPDPSSPWSTQ